MRTGPNIYKRADGRWEARVMTGRKQNGRPQYKSLYGSTYRQVLLAKKGFEQLLPRHSTDKPSSSSAPCPSFSEAAENWLSASKARWKPSTFSKYKNCLDKHLLPAWGLLSLTEVTQERYEDLISQLEAILSGSSIRTVNTVILGCLKYSLKSIPIPCRNPPQPAKKTSHYPF